MTTPYLFLAALVGFAIGFIIGAIVHAPTDPLDTEREYLKKGTAGDQEG